MAKYKLVVWPDVGVKRDDGWLIQNDPANAMWVEYQQWLADGGVPDPADPAPVPALDCDAAQIRLALLDIGKLDVVEAAVSAGTRAMQVKWEKSGRFVENDVDVVGMAIDIGMTKDQVHQLFELARTK